MCRPCAELEEFSREHIPTATENILKIESKTVFTPNRVTKSHIAEIEMFIWSYPAERYKQSPLLDSEWITVWIIFSRL